MMPIPVTTIHRVDGARGKEGKEDDDPRAPVSFPPYPPFFLFSPFFYSTVSAVTCPSP
jgi:hypothetical protein